MAAFIPGESPPEVKTAIFLIGFDIKFQFFTGKITKQKPYIYSIYFILMLHVKL
jgi:hypothetical protein